ncbi:MAG: high-affinity iron transporter [Chloroflexota bacterium]|jgi:high-affinity iron transporter|nr:high-affinity iron transporter [Chloroflexota bacterium]
MTASFLFALRDGLESALIIGLVAAYLTRLHRRDVLGQVLIGAAAAAILCLVLGGAAVLIVGELPELVQATFEGTVAVIAIGLLTWMLFWMRRQGRRMKGELEGEVDVALARGTALGLVGLAFLAVLREGLELTLSVFPLITAGSDGLLVFVGTLLGLLAAAATGWAIFRMGVRINLSRFFNVTGIILIFVAGGLAMLAVHEFHEAGFLPEGPLLFDLSGVLPLDGILGSLLSGLIGYRDAPHLIEGIAYLGYVVPVLTLFIWGDRFLRRQPAPESRPA